jgi:hypothetical protein
MNSLENVKQAYIYLNEKDIPNYFALKSKLKKSCGWKFIEPI